MLNKRHETCLYIKNSQTKTITLILAPMVVTYFPTITTINIAAYAFTSSTDKQSILQKANDFLWALIPIQINAVLDIQSSTSIETVA